MISVQTNIDQVVNLIGGSVLNEPEKIDKMLRTCAVSVLDLMKKRIHQKGMASDGTQIGTYSKGYMKIRTGNFKNAKKTKAGKLKDAGVFTDATIKLHKQTGVFTGEDKVGKARPKYNRTNDTKVIASLTRQMENDMRVIALSGGGYGIGYSNKHNFDKSQWVEATYKKPIFNLAQTEIETIKTIVNAFH